MDEAMHPLTILAVGLYGKTLMNQNGAPIRLVVPWKYGFKSIKSIVQIRFVEKQPPTAWNIANPRSTASTRTSIPRSTIRAGARRARSGCPSLFASYKTQMFNGYGDQVASHVRGHGPEEDYY